MLRGRKESAPKTVLLMNIGTRSTNLVIAKGPDELILIRDLPLGAKALTDGEEKEWITEVRDSLGYARSHGGLRELEAVFLTGGGSGQDLKMLLATAAGVPVDFWNPLEDVELEPGLKVDEGVGPLLAVAIGLAMRQPT
jgi:Tfp pilus assembly PilM family ATPase